MIETKQKSLNSHLRWLCILLQPMIFFYGGESSWVLISKAFVWFVFFYDLMCGSESEDLYLLLSIGLCCMLTSLDPEATVIWQYTITEMALYCFFVVRDVTSYIFHLLFIVYIVYAVGDVEVAQGVAVDVVELEVEVVVAAGVELEVEVVGERTLLRSQRRNLTRSWRPIMLRPWTSLDLGSPSLFCNIT